MIVDVPGVIYGGEVANRPVAETFGMPYNPRFEK